MNPAMSTKRATALPSAASSRTPNSTARNHHWEPRSGDNSCYFPGCRKDANCHCDICVESFNATRDLHSALRLPPKKSKIKTPHPPSFAADPFTPPSSPEPASSVSTTNSWPEEEQKRSDNETVWAVGLKAMFVLVGVWVFLAVDSGVLAVVLKDFGPKLGSKMVSEFGEDAKILERGLKERLGVVEGRVERVIGKGNSRVSNCSSLDSVWKLNQEEGHRLFFQWRCVVYKSLAEELSVWGSPLQTSGILTAGASARSMTLLSGGITEWSEGKLVQSMRRSNGSSWTLGKWSSAAVQLEGGTWVLEYQRSALFQGPGLVGSAWQLLSLRMQMIVKKLKWRLLLGRDFGHSNYRTSREKHHYKHPT